MVIGIKSPGKNILEKKSPKWNILINYTKYVLIPIY